MMQLLYTYTFTHTHTHTYTHTQKYTYTYSHTQTYISALKHQECLEFMMMQLLESKVVAGANLNNVHISAMQILHILYMDTCALQIVHIVVHIHECT